MACRDAVLEDGLALARVWVAAWQAAYTGSCLRLILTDLMPTRLDEV